MDPHNHVAHVLTICQASAAAQQALVVGECLDTLQDYARLTAKDVSDMAAKLERRTGNARVLMPSKVVKNIQTLCFWAREKQRTGQPLLHNEFTPAQFHESLDLMITRGEDTKEAPTIKPDKFDPNKSDEWSRQFTTYLSHVSGKQFSPLNYMMQTEPAPPGLIAREQDMYQYALQGHHFNQDNMTVYHLLSDLVTGTSGYPWIQEFHCSQNGQGAWQALVNHYEGGGQREKHVTAALSTIKTLH